MWLYLVLINSWECSDCLGSLTYIFSSKFIISQTKSYLSQKVCESAPRSTHKEVWVSQNENSQGPFIIAAKIFLFFHQTISLFNSTSPVSELRRKLVLSWVPINATTLFYHFPNPMTVIIFTNTDILTFYFIKHRVGASWWRTSIQRK